MLHRLVIFSLLVPSAVMAETWVDLTHPLSAQSVFWPTAEPFELITEAEGFTEMEGVTVGEVDGLLVGASNSMGIIL